MTNIPDDPYAVNFALPAEPDDIDLDVQPYREPEPMPDLAQWGFAVDDEDEADFVRWACEADARDFLDHSEQMSLGALVSLQSAFYRGWNNDAGDLIADHLAELASRIEATGATTAAEFDARNDALMLDGL